MPRTPWLSIHQSRLLSYPQPALRIPHLRSRPRPIVDCAPLSSRKGSFLGLIDISHPSVRSITLVPSISFVVQISVQNVVPESLVVANTRKGRRFERGLGPETELVKSTFCSGDEQKIPDPIGEFCGGLTKCREKEGEGGRSDGSYPWHGKKRGAHGRRGACTCNDTEAFVWEHAMGR